MSKKLGIVDYVDQFINDSEAKLQPFIVSGILNREYLKGNQNKRVDKRNMLITDKKADPKVYTERKTFNKMLPIYLSRYGILSSNRPIPGFKSTSNSSSTVNGAVEGNNFLNAFSKDIDFKSKYNELVRLSDNDGIAWLKTGIDWAKGDTISKVTTKLDGKKIDIERKEGRTFIDVIPIHEVLINSYNISSPTKISELVFRRPFSCDFIEKKFGYRPKKENIQGDLSAHPYYTDLGFGMRDTKETEYAYVKEYYKKPDALYPKGRYVIAVGEKIIYDGILPYKNKRNGEREIPFTPVSLLSIPGHLIGPTVYNQIIPMQDTYNAVKNRLLEYINHLSIGQLYFWDGSLSNPDAITNKPGRMIKLKRNSRPPQPVQKERIGMEIMGYLQGLDEDMLVTAGLSQLQAFGISKSNMRTDGVVDKIADSDSNKLVNAVDNLSEGLIKAFKQVLYTEVHRHELLTKEYGIAKADSYMLKYNLSEVDPEELDIVNREFLKTSDIALEKKLAHVSNLGLYNPEARLSYRSKIELLDSVNAGYLKETLDPTQRVNYELILTEQDQFLDQLSPIVESFHDHEQHIVEHNIFRLSPLMQKLKSVDKDKYEHIRKAIDAHIQEHEKYGSERSQMNDLENAKAFM